MSQKIRISKSGYNAITETGTDNMVFDSDYNTLKYHLEGSTSLTFSSATPETKETTITHNLGYIPFFKAFVDDPNFSPVRWYMMPYTFADAGAYIYFFVYANTTQLVFRVEHSGVAASVTATFKYKVFRNNTGL